MPKPRPAVRVNFRQEFLNASYRPKHVLVPRVVTIIRSTTSHAGTASLQTRAANHGDERATAFCLDNMLAQTPFPRQTNASASATIWAQEASLRALLMVTTGSANVMPFEFANIPFITFAAIGAHVPFSMNATVRFW